VRIADPLAEVLFLWWYVPVRSTGTFSSKHKNIVKIGTKLSDITSKYRYLFFYKENNGSWLYNVSHKSGATGELLFGKIRKKKGEKKLLQSTCFQSHVSEFFAQGEPYGTTPSTSTVKSYGDVDTAGR
jgi:hypothetical protein